MKNLIDNIENGKFSDAKEELGAMVQTNIAERIAGAQSELGLTASGEAKVEPVVEPDTDDVKVDDVDHTEE